MRETVWMIMQKAFSFYGVHSNMFWYHDKMFVLWKTWLEKKTGIT